jgi:hypothetical protein
MAAGIATFVAIYTLAELSRFYQRLAERRFVRRTIAIGYGTRLGISIIFPIGMTLDMMVGMISVSLVEGPIIESSELAEPAFWVVYLTTLMQGFLLNLILGGYMLVVYAVQLLFAGARSTSKTTVPAV